VITPSGESAWALVLEYIKGVTLNRLASDIFSDDDHPVDPENFQRYCDIYSSALERLSNIHAYGVLRGNLSPPDSATVSSSLIITEPSDNVVFVDFFFGCHGWSHPSAFKGEISFLHVLFLWLSKSNSQKLRDWAAKNVREELRQKPRKRDRL